MSSSLKIKSLVNLPVFHLARALSDRADNRVDFSNIQKAFRSKSTGELARHYLVYKLFSYNVIVDNSNTLLRLAPRVLGKRLYEWLMKRTVYGQFVGGEDLQSLRPTISNLSRAGIHSILDYAVEKDIGDKEPVVMETRIKHKSSESSDKYEYPQLKPTQSVMRTAHRSTGRTYFYEGDPQCEKNRLHFISCIETAAEVTEDGQAFSAIKLTGLGRVEFLLRLSEALLDSEKIFLDLAGSADLLTGVIGLHSLHKGLANLGVDISVSETEQLFMEMDTNKSGRISFPEWSNHFQPGSSLHRLLSMRKGTRTLPAILDKEEAAQMNAVVNRARTLADCARERGVRLMVDAEQTYFQPAIRHIVVNILMPEYNLEEDPVVYNTAQAYLKNAESAVRMDLSVSKRTGFVYGVKLVRGAYMDQEREKAKQEQYLDPVWPTKADTDVCYNKLMRLLIKEAKEGTAHVMVATHNKDTIQFATDCMREAGLEASSRCVVFGQLLGMSDHITYPLGSYGYQAYKYIPYGRVPEVMPYLVRRANENRGIMDTAKDERKIVRRELIRRIL